MLRRWRIWALRLLELVVLMANGECLLVLQNQRGQAITEISVLRRSDGLEESCVHYVDIPHESMIF